MLPIIESQYRAALEMFRQSVTASTDALWNDERHRNPTWRVAYHALFYTHLYLSPSEEEFKPWEHGSQGLHFFETPTDGKELSRDQIVSYAAMIGDWLPTALEAAPLESASGFEWIPFSRLELHLYNIRHLQHHTGQLIERLRTNGIDDTRWVGMG